MSSALTVEWVQVFGNLTAALVGGAIAAGATWLAIGRQMKLQRKVLRRAALEFVDFLLSEQAKILENCLRTKATQNDLWLTDLDRLQANYTLFERNRESLINLPDRALREAVVDLMTGIQTWAYLSRNLVNERLSAEREAANPSTTVDARAQANKKAGDFREQVNNMFPGAIGHMNTSVALAQRIRDLAAGITGID